MLDSQGELTDTRQILFSVNATATDSLSVSDGTRESLTGGDDGSVSCSQRCGNAFALLCFYLKGCNSELAARDRAHPLHDLVRCAQSRGAGW